MKDSHARTEEVRALLSALVQVMVADAEAVTVASNKKLDGSVLFEIDVAERDRGKIVGRDGRIARSLRILLLAIEKQQKAHYRLNIISDRAQLLQTISPLSGPSLAQQEH